MALLYLGECIDFHGLITLDSASCERCDLTGCKFHLH